MNTFDDQKLHRRSIRLKGYDYAQPGAYFVTLVTDSRVCLFGEVDSGIVRLNPFGSIVENEWRRIEERFNRVKVHEWVIMPNHLHGVLVIVEGDLNRAKATNGVGARQECSTQTIVSPFASPLQLAPGSLGAIVGAYKSTTTRLFNALRRCPGEPVWQRNYYEHIIRNEDEWEAIRRYIHDNPARWELDRENPYRDRMRK